MLRFQEILEGPLTPKEVRIIDIIKRNEVLIHDTTWMNLGNSILRKKRKSCVSAQHRDIAKS